MLLNIMTLNIGRVEIDRYKIERSVKYRKFLSEYAKGWVLAHNEMHAFYKFIQNFYGY